MRKVLKAKVKGFTLLEMLAAMSLMAILVALAVPAYTEYTLRGDRAQASATIRSIELAISGYYVRHRTFPDSLDELSLDIPDDPWGKAYVYAVIEGDYVAKHKNGVPLNSDYDLVSKGPDGKTRKKTTNKFSRDDIIRADNGVFVGLSTDY